MLSLPFLSWVHLWIAWLANLICSSILIGLFKDTLKAYFGNVMRCSTLRLWVGYFIYFQFTLVFFWWMSLNSIKEINRLFKDSLLKEINSLLSKGISNIYLKVTLEKYSKLRYSEFKKFVLCQFLGSSNSRRYHWIFKFLVAT